MLDNRSQAHGEQPRETEAVNRVPTAWRRLPLLIALALLVALAAVVALSPPWETGVASSDQAVAGDDPTSSADDVAQDADGDPGGAQENTGSDQEDPGGEQREGFDEGQGADLDELPDGELFGFVTAFTVDAVTFEPAEFLTGDEALEAAREDGMIGPEGDLPNRFYIRYPDPEETLTLPVAADFEASLLDSVDFSESHALDAESLAGLYTGDLETPQTYGLFDYLPVMLLIEGGEAVRADEHYVP